MTGEEQALLRATVGLVRRVPGGTVRTGSPFHPREYPTRTEYVAEFEIAHAPVTVQQYQVFLEDGGPDDPRWWDDAGWDWRKGEADGWGRENRAMPDRWTFQRRRKFHPVVGVTWFEAQAYCAWLSARTKQVVRLPGELEWERAARGDDARPFPWGEEFEPGLTNTVEGDRRDTVPAASLQGDNSPFGVYDLAGNVQDWVNTPYQPLPDERFAPGPLKVARGGSWNDTSYGARTSYRRAYPAGYFFPFLGFRVVVTHR